MSRLLASISLTFATITAISGPSGLLFTMQLTTAATMTFAASTMALVPRQFFDNTPRLCQDPILRFFENYR
jgi:hypothetical protein